MREYEVYHDESKVDGYWHSFIYIPINKKEEIVDYLLNVKNNINSNIGDVSFKDIKNRHKTHHDKPRLIRYWLSYIIAGLQQQKKSKFAMAYISLNQGIVDLLDYLNIRIVILKVRDSHGDMFETMSELEKIETTMRIGLKGGLHYLFSEEKVEVKNFYVDGDEHYHILYGRSLDEIRIIKRLQNELKDNIKLSNECDIVPIAKNDHSPNHPDRMLIQIADITLGAFRYLHQNAKGKNDLKDWMTEPCLNLINKDLENPARMRESRFYKGFSLSEAYIENNEWCFFQLNKKKVSEPENPQTSMF